MVSWLLVLAGLTGGLLLGYLTASTRSRRALGETRHALHAAEARASETASILDRREADLAQARGAAGEAQVEAAGLKATLAAERERIAAQEKLLKEAEARLVEVFKARSAEALESNSKQFLELAKASLEKLHEEAKGDLGEKQKVLEGLVTPIKETLTKYEKAVSELEQKREKAFSTLDENLRHLGEAQRHLQKETGALVNVLKTPQNRGRWGEIALKRIVEIAGMTEHCDFVLQETVTTDDGRLRPDLTVTLPGDRVVVVDAKVSLAAYLESVEATTDDEQKAALKRHGQQVRAHVNRLASKSYGTEVAGSAEFVVMFLPNEAIFGAAVEQDPTLIEYAMERRVVLATPMTLVAILRTVEHGWRQHRIEENAERVSELGRELYGRLVTMSDHLGKVGSRLGQAVDAYNNTVGSFESRVLVTARRFKEMGSGTAAEIAVVEPVTQEPRVLQEEA